MGWLAFETYLLTIFTANTVVKGIYNIITDEGDRHAGFDVATFLPRDAMPGVDYFNIRDHDHLMRLRLMIAMNIVEPHIRDTIIGFGDEDFIGRMSPLYPLAKFMVDANGPPTTPIFLPLNYWLIRDIRGLVVDEVVIDGVQTWILGSPAERNEAFVARTTPEQRLVPPDGTAQGEETQ
jgi:hypothetical protein